MEYLIKKVYYSYMNNMTLLDNVEEVLLACSKHLKMPILTVGLVKHGSQNNC